jgi:hypothetical protein
VVRLSPVRTQARLAPNRIIITTEFTEQVDLPLFKHSFVLRPRAEEAL